MDRLEPWGTPLINIVQAAIRSTLANIWRSGKTPAHQLGEFMLEFGPADDAGDDDQEERAADQLFAWLENQQRRQQRAKRNGDNRQSQGAAHG